MPDDTTFGRIGQRMAPHIYSEQEIVDLLAAARRLGPAPGLRGATYPIFAKLPPFSPIFRLERRCNPHGYSGVVEKSKCCAIIFTYGRLFPCFSR